MADNSGDQRNAAAEANGILKQALVAKASEVRLERTPQACTMQFVINGHATDRPAPAAELAQGIFSRFRTLAQVEKGLNIFSVKLGEEVINIRVKLAGEDVREQLELHIEQK